MEARQWMQGGSMKNSLALSSALTIHFTLAFCATLSAQTDPGPRNGPPTSGRPLAGLAAGERRAFDAGRDSFQEVDNVENGLGPRFNLDSCGGCHAHPALGGTSPRVNPQLAVAAKFGAINRVPQFIQNDGPIRVARFRRDANGNPDGGVHDLFVITGRSDAPEGCNITQPDFTNQGNLSLRIPTPVFGLGLIEGISDTALRANLAADQNRKRQLGIQGRFNTNGNDGTITRFGWKAQNKSLLLFAGEAYNVEIGVTNDLFPQERETDPACATNKLPESQADFETGVAPDIARQAMFMRYLAPPGPPQETESSARGRTLFDQVGCALCHTPTLRTGSASNDALSNQPVNLYSDLATHRMGQGLNDGVTQGDAQGQDWRTAPLWGLGDRIFFLHDGRSRDLLDAIRQHDSQGSESRGVVGNFDALTPDQKQDLLNFLRSL
jgi:CxxC motif-containing protein (DUF1111 family)